MALQYLKDFNQGFSSAVAYAHITRINGNKDMLLFGVEVFFDQTARINGNQPLANQSYEIPMPVGTTNDLMVDLYNHLKSLPEYIDATDV